MSKSEKWTPKYYCVDTRAAKLAMRLSGESRLKFYDGLFSAFMSLVEETEIADPPDDFDGDLLRQAIETMEYHFGTYRKRVFANPDGTKKPPGERGQGSDNTPMGTPMGTAMGTHSLGIDQQSISSERNDISRYDISSIRSTLKAEGYSDDEITYGISRITNRQGLNDPLAYCRKTIIEYRKKPPLKTVSAQQYSQRDYSGMQEEAMMRMIEDARREKLA